jgi:hypothetical protein
MLGCFALAACRGVRAAPVSSSGVAVWSVFDLPKHPLTNELSGIVWDEARRAAYVIQDKRPSIVTLVPDADFRRWRIGPNVAVDVPHATPDLEAIALSRDGFVVADEAGPHIYEVDRAGRVRRELPIPPCLLGARRNKSLESLAITPDGRFLFAANEEATKEDGDLATSHRGTRVRLVRVDRASGETSATIYVTDHVIRRRGDWGVADVAALSETEVLVLERGWSKGYGNSARIYHALRERDGAMTKSLVVDLAALDVSGLSLPRPREPQPTPLLDNFEGLAVGPRLPNGQSSLISVSDDNTRDTQVARVVVLEWSRPSRLHQQV